MPYDRRLQISTQQVSFSAATCDCNGRKKHAGIAAFQATTRASIARAAMHVSSGNFHQEHLEDALSRLISEQTKSNTLIIF
jgi:hypothetical protein